MSSDHHPEMHINTDLQATLRRAIEAAEVMWLLPVDQACVAKALLSPPLPAPALERAFDRRRKLLGAE